MEMSHKISALKKADISFTTLAISKGLIWAIIKF
jgi:hypothetical protein